MGFVCQLLQKPKLLIDMTPTEPTYILTITYLLIHTLIKPNFIGIR